MKTKIIVSACICAIGMAVAIVGYFRMQGASGPVPGVDHGTADSAMVLLWAGGSIALLGAVMTVFAAVRSRE